MKKMGSVLCVCIFAAVALLSFGARAEDLSGRVPTPDELDKILRTKRLLPTLVVLEPQRYGTNSRNEDFLRDFFGEDTWAGDVDVVPVLLEVLRSAFADKYRVLLSVDGRDARQLRRIESEKKYGNEGVRRPDRQMPTTYFTLASWVDTNGVVEDVKLPKKRRFLLGMLNTLTENTSRRDRRVGAQKLSLTIEVEIAISQGRTVLLNGRGKGVGQFFRSFRPDGNIALYGKPEDFKQTVEDAVALALVDMKTSALEAVRAHSR